VSSAPFPMAVTAMTASLATWQLHKACTTFTGAPVVPRVNVAVAAPKLSKRSQLCCVASRSEDATSSATSTSSPVGPVVRTLLCGACVALALTVSSPSLAKERARLPPLSTDPRRCERAFDGNTIGQANGVADKVLDLRKCDYSNDTTNLKGKTLSAALMSEANFDGADLSEVIMSKAYAAGASFKGTLFTNAVVDRVLFDNADMKGAQFINTVLSGSTFDGADLTDASFEDALIGYVDVQKLCLNTTLPDDARVQLGCKRLK